MSSEAIYPPRAICDRSTSASDSPSSPETTARPFSGSPSVTCALSASSPRMYGIITRRISDEANNTLFDAWFPAE